jgi:hypothetical protein
VKLIRIRQTRDDEIACELLRVMMDNQGPSVGEEGGVKNERL